MDQMGRADQKGHKVSYFGTVGENGKRFHMNSQTGIDPGAGRGEGMDGGKNTT